MVRSITRKENIITMQGALILRVDLRRKSSWHFATHGVSSSHPSLTVPLV